jgi:hypothetical protein
LTAAAAAAWPALLLPLLHHLTRMTRQSRLTSGAPRHLEQQLFDWLLLMWLLMCLTLSCQVLQWVL